MRLWHALKQVSRSIRRISVSKSKFMSLEDLMAAGLVWAKLVDDGLAQPTDTKALFAGFRRKVGKIIHPGDCSNNTLIATLPFVRGRVSTVRLAFPRRPQRFYRASGCPFCGKPPAITSQHVPCGLSGAVVGYDVDVACRTSTCGVRPSTSTRVSEDLKDKALLASPSYAVLVEQLKLQAVDLVLEAWNRRPWTPALGYHVKLDGAV